MINRLKKSLIICLSIILIVTVLPDCFVVSAKTESVSLKNKLSMMVGKSKTISVDTSNIKVKKVTWRTSNKKIVSITSNTKLKCKLYAEKTGNVSLYAVCTCVNGKKTLLKKLTCKITVIDKDKDEDEEALVDPTDEASRDTEFEVETNTQQPTEVVKSTMLPIFTAYVPVNTVEVTDVPEKAQPADTMEPVDSSTPKATGTIRPTVMPTIDTEEVIYEQITAAPTVTPLAVETIQPVATMAVQATSEPAITTTEGGIVVGSAEPTKEPEVVESEKIGAKLLIDEKEHMVVGVENGEVATYAIIPEGVKQISNSAFRDCRKLTQVVFPSSLQEIGAYAFSDCVSLENVTIPDSVIKIMEGAFFGCAAMTKFYVPRNVEYIGPLVIGDCQQIREIIVDVENPCFNSENNCNAIIATERSFLISACNYSTIPEGVVGIDFGAYGYCEKMNQITIPDSMRSISQLGFINCFALESIEWKETVYSDFDEFLSDFNVVYPESYISYYDSCGIFDSED